MSAVRLTALPTFLFWSQRPLFFRVLMLRRKASPTQTELRLEHSQMVNEALEMIDVDLHSKGTSDACTSLEAQAHGEP
jgi:hypothetical protein